MNRILTSWLLLFAQSCAGAAARPAEGALRPPLDDRALAPRSQWFGVYLDGHKAGHSHTAAGLEQRPEGAVFVRRARFELHTNDGSTETSVEEVYETRPPHRLLHSLSVTRRHDSESRLAIHRRGPDLEIRFSAADGPVRVTRARLDHDLRDVLALESWVRTGPEPGDEAVIRVLNADAGVVERQRVAVRARRHGTVQGVARSWYELDRTAADGSVEHERRDPEGQVLSWRLGALELRAEPEAVARDLERPVDLDLLGSAPADRPLGDPRRVRRLTLLATGAGAARLADGPGQRVVRLPDGQVRIEIEPAALQPVAAAEESERARRATLRFPADDPRIRDLARQARGEDADPRDTVRRLLSFVAGYVEDSTHDTDHASAQQVLDRRTGDCSDHCLLFVTLARALGIPARPVLGLAWLGDDATAFGRHEWCEVALDGRWVPVDPTWDELPADAARIRLGPDAAASAAVGGFRVRILDIER